MNKRKATRESLQMAYDMVKDFPVSRERTRLLMVLGYVQGLNEPWSLRQTVERIRRRVAFRKYLKVSQEFGDDL